MPIATATRNSRSFNDLFAEALLQKGNDREAAAESQRAGFQKEHQGCRAVRRNSFGDARATGSAAHERCCRSGQKSWKGRIKPMTMPQPVVGATSGPDRYCDGECATPFQQSFIPNLVNR